MTKMFRKIMNTKINNKPFGDCDVFSPSGLLLFRCKYKRVKYYINNNTAVILNENPLKIKFLVIPNKYEKITNHNLISNKCICCGSEEYVTKHHVVPYCYSRYFKDRYIYDILPLCAKCHMTYEKKANELKLKISKQYNECIGGSQLIDNRELITIVKYSITLLDNRNDNIPKERIDLMKNEIKKYFKIKRLSKKKLEKISKINIKISHKSHGEFIISQIKDKDEFYQMWRKHFIENMNCKYLPKNYNISSDENK